MEVFAKLLFYISMSIIVWAMVGYPLSLRLIGKLYKQRKLDKDYLHQPRVTVLVVAHNEEKVILDKLKNVVELNYPKDKIEFLIASDNSTDKTNHIVRKFIDDHPDKDIRLHVVENRKGKTNAQNEAQKVVRTEYLVMTDANSIMDEDSVKELMAAFTSEDIAYVTGKLSIVNREASDISNAEARYWDSDLASREIEGRVQTITAGNGALYACRTKDYYHFNPIQCHDSAMPTFYALEGRRAIANHDAIAYEKAGELIDDEFGRKVRMSRNILKQVLPDIRILNVFKYRWFSYFYFGHRTCRYLLWISHLSLLLSSALLFPDTIYTLVLLVQILFYFMAWICTIIKPNNRILTLVYYYTLTVLAQWVGVYKTITGKARPFWDKAESTR